MKDLNEDIENKYKDYIKNQIKYHNFFKELWVTYNKTTLTFEEVLNFYLRDRLVQLEKNFNIWRKEILEGKVYTVFNPSHMGWNYSENTGYMTEPYISIYTKDEIIEEYDIKLRELKEKTEKVVHQSYENELLHKDIEIENLKRTITDLKTPWYKKIW